MLYYILCYTILYKIGLPKLPVPSVITANNNTALNPLQSGISFQVMIMIECDDDDKHDDDDDDDNNNDDEDDYEYDDDDDDYIDGDDDDNDSTDNTYLFL